MINSKADTRLLAAFIERALKKFDEPSSKERLLREAIWALKDAGHWRDDVRVHVALKGGQKTGRCARLLHGIPSPRFWLVKPGGLQWMAALDIVYFFASESSLRERTLADALPEMNDSAALKDWLGIFSSRRFHPDLICALTAQAEVEAGRSKTPGIGPYILRHKAFTAAEIDRYAWLKGYSSVNLAKAAPIWAPSKETIARLTVETTPGAR